MEWINLNDQEFIYGLVGLIFIGSIWIVILLVKLGRSARNTRNLPKSLTDRQEAAKFEKN